MRRTALLIGAQTYGLTGVHHDVDTMADVLASRHFTVRRGEEATRAGILDGFERLIRDARYADAVVVYYSGHGGIAVGAPASRARLQFLVPTDFPSSTPSDFRGVTAPELSVLLARLTRMTRNVTVIIDSCYAAHMSRDAQLRPKALYQHAYVDVAAHLDRLRRDGLDPAIRHVLGNPEAVRVVACGRDQSAYEYTNDAGRRIGVFTESLAMTLRQAGEQPATWATLIERVRRRVATVVPFQRPEAEGPSLRLPFQSAVSYPSGPLPALGSAMATLGAEVAIEWGRVAQGQPVRLPFEGAVVHAGEHVYVRIRNNGGSTVYMSLLLIEEFARVSLITSLDPSGVALGPGQEQTVGRDELDGRLVGFELAWPPAMERGSPLQRTLAVLIGSAPRDMSLLQREDPPDDSTLDTGPARTVYRDVRPSSSAGRAGRDVHRIIFQLHPNPRRDHRGKPA